jgi:lipopolysaccharide export system protein LptA
MEFDSLRPAKMILRYLSALVTTLGAYAIYAVLLAPLIEGQPGEATPGSPVPVESRLPADIKRELTGLIPADGWEWDACTIVESPQAKLFFKTHVLLDDGSVELNPLTMVLAPPRQPASAGDEATNRQPVVLRAPHGARLKFEKALSLSGDHGNLENGQLRGEVQIFRRSTAPDRDDALSLVTSNVQLSRERIFTLYDCSFHFGQSFGRGKRLTIDLFGPAARQKSDTTFAGIERIELGSVDEMYLHRSAMPSGDNARSTSSDLLEGANDSLWIGCAGPMQFDFANNLATLADDVVIRTADGQNQLNCEDLTVFLAPAAEAGQSSESRTKQMEVRRLQARGTPAVLTSVSRNAQITAASIDFDLLTKTVILTDRESAILVRDGQTIYSPAIQYTFSEDGRIGNAVIRGPGSIQQANDETRSAFHCKWRELLTLQDDQKSGCKVLTLDGAVVEMTDLNLNADQLNLWIREIPESTAPGKTRYRIVPAKMLAEGLVKIVSPELEGDCSEAAAYWPDPGVPVARLHPSATSRVGVRRALRQQAGRTNGSSPPQPEPAALASLPATTSLSASPNLVWRSAQQPAAHPEGNNPVQRAAWQQAVPESVTPPRPVEAANGDRARPAGKTRFVGQQVQLQMLGGDDSGAIEEITVDGDVVVQQQQAGPDGQFTTVLEIRGQQLRGVSLPDEQSRLYVAGTPSRPATVTAREIALSGLQIHLDQTANRLWIDGSGEMQLRAGNRQPHSRLAGFESPPDSSPVPMNAGNTTVQWAGGMVFDGEKLYFETGVQSHTRQTSAADGVLSTTTTTSAALSIVLNQRIDFQKTDGAKQPNNLKADKLVMVGWMDRNQAAFPNSHVENSLRQVWIASGRYDETGKLVSSQELYSPRATYDVDGGEINCQGNGTVMVRQLAGDAAGDPAPARLPHSGQRSGPIDFIRVDFDERFTGNLQQRQLNFRGNVHTLYTDTVQWTDIPADSVLRNPLRRGMMLDCDELVLVQWSPRGGDPVVDMTATGNARVKGSQFDATAERISYFEGNGLVTVEAPERGDAEFWFQKPDQTDRGHLIARRIVYNLATGTYEVDQMKQLDYSQNR